MADVIYSTTPISPSRSLTAEGFLLAVGVPVASTKPMAYLGREVPSLTNDPNAIIYLRRTEDELFSTATLSSFEGRSITLGHPEEGVSPENYQDVTVGVMLNVRADRKAGDLLADLLIQDRAAIQAVQEEGLREVSLGYTVGSYEQTEAGVFDMIDVTGNHIALVERGRAGPEYRIQDKENDEVNLIEQLVAKLSEADKADKQHADAAAQAEAIGNLTAAVASLQEELAALKAEKSHADEAAEKPEPEADEAEVKPASAETISAAELVAPGVAKEGSDEEVAGRALNMDACPAALVALMAAAKHIEQAAAAKPPVKHGDSKAPEGYKKPTAAELNALYRAHLN